MAGARRRRSGSRSPTPAGAELTRVGRPDDDDEAVASSISAQELARPTEAQPVVGRTPWDLVYASGATEHATRVLRELDPVELIALLAYAYVLWIRPGQDPNLLMFLGALAIYHLVLRPLTRLGLGWVVSKMR